MPNFGEKLRRERERRKVALPDVAEATKISLRYLTALEGNDFQSLPGGVFNRGFVRAYAQFLGADVEGLVRAYVAEERSRGLEQADEGLESLRAAVDSRLSAARPGAARRRRVAALLAAATGVALLAVAAWLLGPWRRPAVPLPRSPLLAAGASLDTSGAPSIDGVAPPAAHDAEATTPSTSDEPPSDGSSTPAASGEPSDDASSAPTPRDDDAVAVRRPEPEIPPARAPQPEPPASEPTTADERETAASVARAPLSISVVDFGVGTAVVNHQLQGRGDRFEEGTVVWFWTRVVGGEGGERIRHVWFHEGQQVGMAPLTLGGPHWRTQSRRTLEPAGQWVVEVRDAADRVLARKEFLCVPAGAAVDQEPS